MNEEYDKGKIIGQHNVDLIKEDSIEDIQKKVQALEHKWFAKDIEKYILENNA